MLLFTAWGWLSYWIGSRNGRQKKKYRSPRPKAVADFSAKSGNTYLAFVVILLVGLVLPLSETLIPRQFTPTEMNTRLNRIISNEDKVFSQNDIERMEDLLSRPDSDVWYGRALYPRFFEADDGMIGLGGTYIRPFPRMEFYLVGTENNFSYMPHREAVQIDHAADVLLIGRRGVASSYFDIVAVIPFTEDGITPRTIFWSDISLEE